MNGLDPLEFKTDVVRQADAVVVRAIGELDISSSELLSVALEEAITISSSVVVDLSGMTFIDSSGLSVLVRVKQWLDISGGTLTLRSPRDQALTALQAAGLDAVLGIEK